jgi:two-component system, chemotaxis family, protein-glutamate methylesterase/glutaminase
MPINLPKKEFKIIRVLIVDDSSLIRKILTQILKTDPEIEVIGAAHNPYEARQMIYELKPDVMTLDIEMPRMDGLTFLDALMKHWPIRTLVFSSLTEKNSSLILSAYERGAIDVMAKPSIDINAGVELLSIELIERVKAVARAKLDPPRSIIFKNKSSKIISTKLSLEKTTHQILAIASSTGGTEALKVVLTQLPSDIPGILIVQHMPPVFTKAYAQNLSKICSFEVKEAENGDRVLPGRALLAPGDFHMELTRSGAFYYVKLHQEAKRNGTRPSADYLLNSVAKYAGKNALGVILTGMGKDGTEGLVAMKEAGSYNIAQDEETCVVFGMPKSAIQAGAIHEVCPLEKIPYQILREFKKRSINSSST